MTKSGFRIRRGTCGRPEPTVVSNRATVSAEGRWVAMRAHDIDSLVGGCADQSSTTIDADGGDQSAGAAIRRHSSASVAQYSRFERRTLAVRGDR